MIHYGAIENKVLTTYFWWALVSVPYYVAKLVIASQRSDHPFLNTRGGKIYAYSVGILAVVALTFLLGGSPQNRVGVFAIVLAPAILGVYSGFGARPVLPVIKEDYVTVAQQKVNALGRAITDSSSPSCIPLSELPYPVTEMKEAIQRLYLYSPNDVERRVTLQTAYTSLADFVPDGKAEVVRLWYQSVDAVAKGGKGVTLGEEGSHIIKEMQAQHDLLGNEWENWLRSVEQQAER